MKENTGSDIVVENKPGGGGVAMFTGLSQRPSQAKVVGMGGSIPVLVQRGDQLPFRVDGFDYPGAVARTELAVVASKDAPFNTLEEMVACTKEKGSLPVATMAPSQVLLMNLGAEGTHQMMVDGLDAAKILFTDESPRASPDLRCKTGRSRPASSVCC